MWADVHDWTVAKGVGGGQKSCEKYLLTYMEIGMIQKDKTKRITIEQLLMHPLIASSTDDIKEMREAASNMSKFKLFSLQSPNEETILSEPEKTMKGMGLH